MRVSWIFDLEQGLLLTSCMKSCCGPCCCSSNLLEPPRPSSAIRSHALLSARPRDSNKPLVNWRVHLLFRFPSLTKAFPPILSPNLSSTCFSFVLNQSCFLLCCLVYVSNVKQRRLYDIADDLFFRIRFRLIEYLYVDSASED